MHEPYLFLLYDLFQDYSSSLPRKYESKADIRTDKIYSTVIFQTYSLPCFNKYYELFYLNKVKIVPLNIGELLTARGLAYWAMDDGAKLGSGFTFSTNSFQTKEVELLIQVLTEKFYLNCSAHIQRKEEHRIYIKSDSMNKFKELVRPYFHESMLYKLD